MSCFNLFCHFPARCPVSGVKLIVSIPDLCLLTYLDLYLLGDNTSISYGSLNKLSIQVL